MKLSRESFMKVMYGKVKNGKRCEKDAKKKYKGERERRGVERFVENILRGCNGSKWRLLYKFSLEWR